MRDTRTFNPTGFRRSSRSRRDTNYMDYAPDYTRMAGEAVEKPYMSKSNRYSSQDTDKSKPNRKADKPAPSREATVNPGYDHTAGPKPGQPGFNAGDHARPVDPGFGVRPASRPNSNSVDSDFGVEATVNPGYDHTVGPKPGEPGFNAGAHARTSSVPARERMGQKDSSMIDSIFTGKNPVRHKLAGGPANPAGPKYAKDVWARGAKRNKMTQAQRDAQRTDGWTNADRQAARTRKYNRMRAEGIQIGEGARAREHGF